MARNQELNERMKDERRGKILSEALKLFANKGLAATKISHICEAVGMSQGLMYHYFRSKEEIFTELIGSAFEKMTQSCFELENLEAEPLEKIERAFKALFEGFARSEEAAKYHLLIAQATASDAIPDEAKKIIKKNNKYPYEMMQRIIVEGQNNGTVKQQDPEEMSVFFWTTIKGIALHKASFGKSFKLPDVEIPMAMFKK